MGTLVVVEHHRNHHQYDGRKRDHDLSNFGSFGSAPPGYFRGINCRTFEHGAGLLPTPRKPFSSNTSFTRKGFMVSPKTPSPSVNENQKTGKHCTTPIPINLGNKAGEFCFSECWAATKAKSSPPSVDANHKSLRSVQSSTVPVPIKINFKNKADEFNFYERWAGPAYSNSPPPSSLPMPKFSMHPKRTVSLDLPSSTPKFDFHAIAKSAPSSPTREHSPSFNDLFDSPVSATKNLCRILNLDLTDN